VRKNNGNDTRIRFGKNGAEATLWRFTMGFPGEPDDEGHGRESEVQWVAAESLQDALGYITQQQPKQMILKIEREDLIPIISCSPID
jgi:hypothetical protein